MRRGRVSGTGYISWRSAETALQNLTGGVKKGFPPIPPQRGTAGYRFVDSYNAATGVAAEAKTGFAKLTPFVQRQIDKDKLLLAQGRVTKLEWHLYPSSPVRDRRALARAARRAAQQGDRLHHPSTLIR